MAKSPIPEPGAPIQLGEFLQGDHRFPAVYFLHDEGALVYVGQSTTLRWRIEAHLQEGVKIFDEVSFIPCCVSRLLEIESHYIRKWTPRYNQCALAKSVREVDGWAPDDLGLKTVDGVLTVGSIGLSSIMGCDREMAKGVLNLIGKERISFIDALHMKMTVKLPDANGVYR